MRIYIAGPLTNLTDPERTKAFYKDLAAVARTHGHEPYLAFLSGTDPVANPAVSPRDVYERDIAELEKSDLIVAYAGEPSTGMGLEIEHAHQKGIPVCLLYEKGRSVSRMLRGCPAVKREIVFTDFANCLSLFDELLTKLRTVDDANSGNSVQ